MPRYYVPPAPGTASVRPRLAWRLPLLLAVGGLLVAGLLTPPGHQLLEVIAWCAVLLLYLAIVWSLPLLVVGVLLYLVSRVDRRYQRRLSPPRPAPRWVWATWEIVLCLVALLLAALYYAATDARQWLRRRWRRRRARRATA